MLRFVVPFTGVNISGVNRLLHGPVLCALLPYNSTAHGAASTAFQLCGGLLMAISTLSAVAMIVIEHFKWCIKQYKKWCVKSIRKVTFKSYTINVLY